MCDRGVKDDWCKWQIVSRGMSMANSNSCLILKASRNIKHLWLSVVLILQLFSSCFWVIIVTFVVRLDLGARKLTHRQHQRRLGIQPQLGKITADCQQCDERGRGSSQATARKRLCWPWPLDRDLLVSETGEFIETFKKLLSANF